MAKSELIDPVVGAPVKQANPSAYTDSYLRENADLQRRRDFVNSGAYRNMMEQAARFNIGRGSRHGRYNPNMDPTRGYYNSNKISQQMTTNTANSNLRRGLLDAIGSAPADLREEQRLLHNEAGSALTEGLKNTRQNFNSRGMLYSGLRQAGEQSLRNQVASSLAKQQVSAARDSDKMVLANKQQLATIGMRANKEAAVRAEQTFEAKMRADIARRQALQQFTEGVGYGAGALYGMGQEQNATPERRNYYGTKQYISPEDY